MSEIKQVGSNAFSNVSSLTYVNMGKVERIGSRTLYYARLNYISLPSTLRTIENEAFRNAFTTSGNVSVTIPSNITSIEEGAFRDNPRITSISFKNTASILSYFAYGNTGLSSVNFPNVRLIGTGAFENTTSLIIVTANSVRKVGNYAFRNTGLRTVSLPNARIIGKYAFVDNSSLTIQQLLK